MSLKHLLGRLRRIAGRAVVMFALSGGVSLAYGVATIWVITGSAPAAKAWLLVAPLAGAIALLSASLMLAINLAPALAVARFLRYLEHLPALLAERPRLSNRELAKRLECSEAEVNDLRQLIAGAQQLQSALPALTPERAA